MGLPGMVLSACAFVAGAIMYWALTPQTAALGHAHGFKVSTVGVILMVAGGIGFVASVAVYATSRRSPVPTSRTVDTQTVDPQGRTSAVHEEQH